MKANRPYAKLFDPAMREPGMPPGSVAGISRLKTGNTAIWSTPKTGSVAPVRRPTTGSATTSLRPKTGITTTKPSPQTGLTAPISTLKTGNAANFGNTGITKRKIGPSRATVSESNKSAGSRFSKPREELAETESVKSVTTTKKSKELRHRLKTTEDSFTQWETAKAEVLKKTSKDDEDFKLIAKYLSKSERECLGAARKEDAEEQEMCDKKAGLSLEAQTLTKYPYMAAANAGYIPKQKLDDDESWEKKQTLSSKQKEETAAELKNKVSTKTYLFESSYANLDKNIGDVDEEFDKTYDELKWKKELDALIAGAKNKGVIDVTKQAEERLKAINNAFSKKTVEPKRIADTYVLKEDRSRNAESKIASMPKRSAELFESAAEPTQSKKTWHAILKPEAPHIPIEVAARLSPRPLFQPSWENQVVTKRVRPSKQPVKNTDKNKPSLEDDIGPKSAATETTESTADILELPQGSSQNASTTQLQKSSGLGEGIQQLSSTIEDLSTKAEKLLENMAAVASRPSVLAEVSEVTEQTDDCLSEAREVDARDAGDGQLNALGVAEEISERRLSGGQEVMPREDVLEHSSDEAVDYKLNIEEVIERDDVSMSESLKVMSSPEEDNLLSDEETPESCHVISSPLHSTASEEKQALELLTKPALKKKLRKKKLKIADTSSKGATLERKMPAKSKKRPLTPKNTAKKSSRSRVSNNQAQIGLVKNPSSTGIRTLPTVQKRSDVIRKQITNVEKTKRSQELSVKMRKPLEQKKLKQSEMVAQQLRNRVGLVPTKPRAQSATTSVTSGFKKVPASAQPVISREQAVVTHNKIKLRKEQPASTKTSAASRSQSVVSAERNLKKGKAAIGLKEAPVRVAPVSLRSALGSKEKLTQESQAHLELAKSKLREEKPSTTQKVANSQTPSVRKQKVLREEEYSALRFQKAQLIEHKISSTPQRTSFRKKDVKLKEENIRTVQKPKFSEAEPALLIKKAQLTAEKISPMIKQLVDGAKEKCIEPKLTIPHNTPVLEKIGVQLTEPHDQGSLRMLRNSVTQEPKISSQEAPSMLATSVSREPKISSHESPSMLATLVSRERKISSQEAPSMLVTSVSREPKISSQESPSMPAKSVTREPKISSQESPSMLPKSVCQDPKIHSQQSSSTRYQVASASKECQVKLDESLHEDSKPLPFVRKPRFCEMLLQQRSEEAASLKKMVQDDLEKKRLLAGMEVKKTMAQLEAVDESPQEPSVAEVLESKSWQSKMVPKTSERKTDAVSKKVRDMEEDGKTTLNNLFESKNDNMISSKTLKSKETAMQVKIAQMCGEEEGKVNEIVALVESKLNTERHEEACFPKSEELKPNIASREKKQHLHAHPKTAKQTEGETSFKDPDIDEMPEESIQPKQKINLESEKSKLRPTNDSKQKSLPSFKDSITKAIDGGATSKRKVVTASSYSEEVYTSPVASASKSQLSELSIKQPKHWPEAVETKAEKLSSYGFKKRAVKKMVGSVPNIKEEESRVTEDSRHEVTGEKLEHSQYQPPYVEKQQKKLLAKVPQTSHTTRPKVLRQPKTADPKETIFSAKSASTFSSVVHSDYEEQHKPARKTQTQAESQKLLDASKLNHMSDFGRSSYVQRQVKKLMPSDANKILNVNKEVLRSAPDSVRSSSSVEQEAPKKTTPKKSSISKQSIAQNIQKAKRNARNYKNRLDPLQVYADKEPQKFLVADKTSGLKSILKKDSKYDPKVPSIHRKVADIYMQKPQLSKNSKSLRKPVKEVSWLDIKHPLQQLEQFYPIEANDDYELSGDDQTSILCDDFVLDEEKELLKSAQFATETFHFMEQLSQKHSIKENHLSNQKYITPKHRAELVDWLITQHYEFDFYQSTYYMAVRIIDRYLQAVPDLKPADLSKIGMTALFIAVNYEDKISPNDFLKIIPLTAEDFENTSLAIQKALDFDMTMELPSRCLTNYVRLAKPDTQQVLLARYLMQLATTDYKLASCAPRLLAAAALYLALNVFTETTDGFHPELWTEQLQHYSGFTVDMLIPITKQLARLAWVAPKSKLNAAYRKFRSSKFHGVARVCLCSALRAHAI